MSTKVLAALLSITCVLSAMELEIANVALDKQDSQVEWCVGLPKDMWQEIVLHISSDLSKDTKKVEQLAAEEGINLEKLPEGVSYSSVYCEFESSVKRISPAFCEHMRALVALQTTNRFLNQLLSANVMGSILKNANYNSEDLSVCRNKICRDKKGIFWVQVLEIPLLYAYIHEDCRAFVQGFLVTASDYDIKKTLLPIAQELERTEIIAMLEKHFAQNL